jgi:hypothetical protein
MGGADAAAGAASTEGSVALRPSLSVKSPRDIGAGWSAAQVSQRRPTGFAKADLKVQRGGEVKDSRSVGPRDRIVLLPKKCSSGVGAASAAAAATFAAATSTMPPGTCTRASSASPAAEEEEAVVVTVVAPKFQVEIDAACEDIDHRLRRRRPSRAEARFHSADGRLFGGGAADAGGPSFALFVEISHPAHSVAAAAAAVVAVDGKDIVVGSVQPSAPSQGSHSEGGGLMRAAKAIDKLR